MNTKTICDRLSQLDEYEKLGKQFYQQAGKKLSYGQYLTLLIHYGHQVPLDLLETEEFKNRQKVIEHSFHADSHGSLSEAGFFQEDANIEIEQLLRYIDIPAHRHGFVECSYIFQGSCTQTVNGNTYIQNTGTFSVINSGTDHQITADENCICLTIKIRQKTFLNLKIPNLPVFAAPVFVECGSDPFIRDRILEMYRQQQEKLPYHDLLMENLFSAILIHFCQAYHDSFHYFLPGSILEGKLLEIAVYLYENYQTITLHSLAEHFHYSDAYLSNMFRQKANTTFTEILRNFRLEQAKNLLITSKLKLAEVCDQVGYRDQSQFIRDYKKRFGTTPIQYRKKHMLSDE